MIVVASAFMAFVSVADDAKVKEALKNPLIKKWRDSLDPGSAWAAGKKSASNLDKLKWCTLARMTEWTKNEYPSMKEADKYLGKEFRELFSSITDEKEQKNYLVWQQRIGQVAVAVSKTRLSGIAAWKKICDLMIENGLLPK